MADGTLKYQAFIQPRDPRDLLGRRRETLTGVWTTSYEAALEEENNLRLDWDSRLQEFRQTLTGTLTVGDAYDLYYRTVRMEHHEPRTIQSWQATSPVLHNYFKHVRLKNLDSLRVKTFAIQYSEGKSRSSDSSVNKHLIHLRALLEHAANEGIIDTNPIPHNYRAEWFGTGVRQKIMDAKITHSTDQVLEPSEIRDLRNYFKDLTITDKNVHNIVTKIGIMIATFTGNRPGELQAIRPTDIIWDSSLSRMSFTIHDSFDDQHKIFNGRTKTGTERTTRFLPDWASDIVKTYLETRDKYLSDHGLTSANSPILLSLYRLTETQENYPVTQTSLNQTFRRIANEIGIHDYKRLTVYWLRHTVATDLAERANGKYADAAQLMGHSVTTFLEHYVHARRETETAMALSDFE